MKFYYYENEVNNKKALEIVTKITSSVTPIENFPEQAAISRENKKLSFSCCDKNI